MYNHTPDSYDCPFCGLVEGRSTQHNSPVDIVYRDHDVLAFVSPLWWLKNPGIVLVIPQTHYEHIYEIPDELLAKVQIVGKQIALAMKQSYQCDGVSLRQHNEPSGDQDVWYFHLQVLPRWEHDNLYINHN